jgi:hypothetical protein
MESPTGQEATTFDERFFFRMDSIAAGEAGQLTPPSSTLAHWASWKMMPRVWRWPERSRLTP